MRNPAYVWSMTGAYVWRMTGQARPVGGECIGGHRRRRRTQTGIAQHGAAILPNEFRFVCHLSWMRLWAGSGVLHADFAVMSPLLRRLPRAAMCTALERESARTTATRRRCPLRAGSGLTRRPLSATAWGSGGRRVPVLAVRLAPWRVPCGALWGAGLGQWWGEGGLPFGSARGVRVFGCARVCHCLLVCACCLRSPILPAPSSRRGLASGLRAPPASLFPFVVLCLSLSAPSASVLARLFPSSHRFGVPSPVASPRFFVFLVWHPARPKGNVGFCCAASARVVCACADCIPEGRWYVRGIHTCFLGFPASARDVRQSARVLCVSMCHIACTNDMSHVAPLPCARAHVCMRCPGPHGLRWTISVGAEFAKVATAIDWAGPLSGPTSGGTEVGLVVPSLRQYDQSQAPGWRAVPLCLCGRSRHRPDVGCLGALREFGRRALGCVRR